MSKVNLFLYDRKKMEELVELRYFNIRCRREESYLYIRFLEGLGIRSIINYRW